MAEQAPEHQDRSLFGLFGKKEEEGEKYDEKIIPPPATQTDNEAQTEAASYYPAAPQPGIEHCQGHGHEGQLTPEEAEQQKHKGLMGKLHRTNSSSSSSSSDEEEEGEKKKEGGRKKKGAKDKTKEKLPEVQHHPSDQCTDEGEKKAGLIDKIKEKLPGHHNKKDGEEEEKLPGIEQHSSDQCTDEGEKKAGLLDKIKEKLPGHQNKKDGDVVEKKRDY